ncbi:MAG: AMP-binding protein, partial [Myxococcota bacterium]
QGLDLAEQRALLLFENDINFVVTFLGCLYARVVAVPAYPPRSNHHLRRLQSLIEDAQSSVVLASPYTSTRFRQQIDELPALAEKRWLDLNDVNEGLADQWKMPDLRSDTLAFLQYTSGSLGAPKGVMVGHNSLIHNSIMLGHAFSHTDSTVVVSWLPLFHDMGLIGNLMQALFQGVPCVLMSPVAFVQEPARWLRAISTFKGTTSGGPNSAYNLCLRRIKDEQIEGIDLSSWQVAFDGSEPIRADVVDAFADRFAPYGLRRSSMYPCYGMAEATLFVTGADATIAPKIRSVDATALEDGRIEDANSGQPTRRLVSCGRIWLEQEIAIVDPTTLTVCPPGRVGEIWLA